MSATETALLEIEIHGDDVFAYVARAGFPVWCWRSPTGGLKARQLSDLFARIIESTPHIVQGRLVELCAGISTALQLSDVLSSAASVLNGARCLCLVMHAFLARVPMHLCPVTLGTDTPQALTFAFAAGVYYSANPDEWMRSRASFVTWPAVISGGTIDVNAMFAGTAVAVGVARTRQQELEDMPPAGKLAHLSEKTARLEFVTQQFAHARTLTSMDNTATCAEVVHCCDAATTCVYFACHQHRDCLVLQDTRIATDGTVLNGFRPDGLVLPHCELVVLSAFGLDDALARAFIGTGVRAVIRSFWPVPEDAMVSLGTRFFNLLKTEPAIGAAGALQRAQMQERDAARRGEIVAPDTLIDVVAVRTAVHDVADDEDAPADACRLPVLDSDRTHMWGGFMLVGAA